MWSLAGSQAAVQLICCFGPGSCVAGWSPALCLSRVGLADPASLGLSHSALGSTALGLWVGQLASAPVVHPPEVSGVGPQFANLRARHQASGERWGCLSRGHRPGAEGGGAPEARAAAESSLNSC